MNTNTKKQYWSENEAAEYCGVPRFKMEYLRYSGKLNPTRVGRAVLYTETDLKFAKMLIAERGDKWQRKDKDNKREEEVSE